MQQFKSRFTDPRYRNTISNVQSCLRLNDLEEIGDGTHLLFFNMIGLFSFRQMTVNDTIRFWFEFLSKLDITPDYVTIHPDKSQWSRFYDDYGVEIRYDDDCTWSDGNLGGYCTEFFVDDIEIGNIVNPCGDCIDVGFGLERLELIMGTPPKSDIDILKETIIKIVESGYRPGGTKQGYILRKLLRILVNRGEVLEHQFFYEEKERQIRLHEKYNRLKKKYHTKSKEWWYDTHGIDVDGLE